MLFRSLDKEYKNFVAEMYAAGHSFFTYLSDNPDAVASCCRLRNEVSQNTFSSTTGLTGVQTGSINVITLNINRIVQDYFRSFPTDCNINCLLSDKSKGYPFLKKYLSNIVERVHKYHIAYREMLYKLEDAGMLASSKAGYISMSKLYSTIGVNGHNEAAEFLGLKVSNNKDYIDFITTIFNVIKELNLKNSTKRCRFNLEVVPAESLGVKFYNWDKEDGLEPMPM